MKSVAAGSAATTTATATGGRSSASPASPASPAAGSGGAAGMPAPVMASATPSMQPAGPIVAACMAHAGEVVCDRASLHHCGDMGHATSSDACANPLQCRAGMAAGQCGMCDPGQYRCSDANLESCDSTGQWTMDQTCPSAALCQNGLAKKSCDPMKCEAGSFDCSDGLLRKCMDDLTDFDQGVACDAELCDAMAGKCNECVPKTAECSDAGSAVVCDADGKKTETPCAGTTPYCVAGKCVACTGDDQCQSLSECLVPSCDTGRGMCALGDPKPLHTGCSYLGGAGHCDLIGNCVACFDDSDCSASERCNPVLGCTDRPPLQLEVSLLPGVYSVTVSPGYSVQITATSDLPPGGQISVTQFPSTFCNLRSKGACPVLASSDQARTLTISGPSGAGCGPGLAGVNAGTSLTLGFGETSDAGATQCTTNVTVEAITATRKP